MACTLRIAAETAQPRASPRSTWDDSRLCRQSASAAPRRQRPRARTAPYRRSGQRRGGPSHRAGQSGRSGGRADERGARVGSHARDQGADRGPLYPRGGPTRPRYAMAKAQNCEAMLFGLVASTEDMREGTGRFSKSAAGIQGDAESCALGSSSAPLGRCFGLPLRGCGLALQRDVTRAACATAPCARLREAGAAESNIQVFDVPGAFEIPQAARAAAETRPVRRGRLSRLHHSWRDAAFRIHRLRRCARHHLGLGRHRRPDGVRRLDDEQPGAGDGARRDTPDNKGREAAAAAIEMAACFGRLPNTPRSSRSSA